jgi:hypothetical protein
VAQTWLTDTQIRATALTTVDESLTYEKLEVGLWLAYYLEDYGYGVHHFFDTYRFASNRVGAGISETPSPSRNSRRINCY